MIRILVIEDEQALREEIVDMLTFEDFDVVYADNGRTGVQAAQQHLPDLVICDVTMPELDGYGVLTELREEAVTATIPFIFLTARADKSFMRHGMELGADDYITKPFTRGELLAAIRMRLKRHADLVESHRRELDEAKIKLARLVAHELRTPLFSISSVQSIIERQFAAAGAKELMDIMGSGVERLSHLVEQMVYVTQLESGLLNPEAVRKNGIPVPIFEALHDAINLGRRFAQRNHEANVRLEDQDGEAKVVAHSHALKHGLAELIANALNFSPERGEVIVDQWQDEEGIWVRILDQGSGMSASEQQQALEAFVQVDRENREQQGLGLGLPIANRIIEAHGGSLELKSTPGQGTEALINLPLANEAAP